jgi:N-acetyl-anhydromuramyl-L-alanine amidase AmpD
MTRKINRIIVHHSALGAVPDFGPLDSMEAIKRFHVERNGWRDVGYHYVIERSGEVKAGRPHEEQGAHAKDHNHDTLGICMVGEGGLFTPAQISALTVTLRWLCGLYALPCAAVMGHRDLAATECPGFDVRSWWAGAGGA